MRQIINKDKTLGFLVILAVFAITSCTKSRNAELPEDIAPDVYEISMFGAPQESSAFSANVSLVDEASNPDKIQILDFDEAQRLSSEDVNVPGRIKFMFDSLPLTSRTDKQFNISFSVDKNNITAYKVVNDAQLLNAIEKSIAISAREANLISKIIVSKKNEAKTLAQEQKSAAQERELIKAGKATGTLLVPMFKYEIAAYGILERTKNELKEQTSVLRLKETDWSQATHIKINSRTDARKVIGLSADQVREMKQLFRQDKIDKRLLTVEQLAEELKIGIKFLNPKAQVVTKLSPDALLVYEVTDLSKLTEEQVRIYKNGGSGGRVVSCNDVELKGVISNPPQTCVIVLVAGVPVAYKKLELSLTDPNGTTSATVQSIQVPKSQSVGMVEILENSTARQYEVTGLLDPDSSIRIEDLKGEFMFRRTLEDAATSFIGRTGTSSDMNIIKFELEEDRLVVRNQMSLIKYTGQGAKDREELMSIPVKYYYVEVQDAHGSNLVLKNLVETTKEKANYIKLDWTRNTIPDASSPLAFYDAGSCFIADSSKKVTGMDMRLANDGVLNFSISSSHTVDTSCAAIKDVNAAYWAALAQLNFNVIERISFVKHKGTADIQFTENISHMAQEAFNYGVFTLADKNNESGALNNRDGSEKYLPMIHDLRNGKTMKWYLGGINNPEATNPERRQLLVEATKQVVDEWNRIFAYAFKGTTLERSGDYLELVIEEPGKETGRLGDLDRNYIWLNEIPADNGLLGVAQPAANPRSGVIESANAIVYTGNTYEQTKILLKMTELARDYEKKIEQMKTKALKELKENGSLDVGQTEQGSIGGGIVKEINQLTSDNKKYLKDMIKYFDLDKQNVRNMLSGMTSTATPQLKLNTKIDKNVLKRGSRSDKVNLPTNSSTMIKKIADMAMNKRLMQNEREFEFRINDMFLAHGGLSEDVKSLVNRRQQILAMSVRFDRATQNRPGCFLYSRNEINDMALAMDPDPHKNLMLNFKQGVMSTLSHELGHAFGLMHNFKASTDKANYEFPGEKTGRNYSSIMDYVSDIDQYYAGPGPYDAHAIRAAYTGYVEMDARVAAANAKAFESLGIKLINKNMIHIKDIMKVKGVNSLVHFTKDTLNIDGIIKHYEQCSDGGTYTSIMCNRFDTGGSAVEIVNTMIADYNRSFATRNYVSDKIVFGWPQKIQIIIRNIQTFAQIRAFLDEAFSVAFIYGSGRPQNVEQQITNDLLYAAFEGYKFFQDVIRTPTTNSGYLNDNRYTVFPFQYKTIEVDSAGNQIEKTVKDVKIVEARPVWDVGLSRDKVDTMGIVYDKMFALNFLMSASSVDVTSDAQQSVFSFKDFEQYILGMSDPSQSLIVNLMYEVMTDNLSSGFFSPSGTFIETGIKVPSNQYIDQQAAVGAVIGFYESKWSSFDAFAESFKLSSSRLASAPKYRLNVARMGEDRTRPDTLVYFATQNGIASQALIQSAANADVYLTNKAHMVSLLNNMLTADLKHMGRDQEDPVVQAAKADADQMAAALLVRIREYNELGGIMPKVYDDPQYGVYQFESQVIEMRKFMFNQLQLFMGYKSILEKAAPETLNAEIQKVVTEIQKIRPVNDQLSAVPLIGYAQAFLVEGLSGVNITLKNGQVIAGSEVIGSMMDGVSMQQSQPRILDIIDRLTYFTRLVDPNLGVGN